jgi:hypothetical protein
MGNPIEKVGELSVMNRDLSTQTKESLRGTGGSYVSRLESLLQVTSGKPWILSGTSVGRPTVLTHNRRSRLQEEIMPAGFQMPIRELETPEGLLVVFPMSTMGITSEGTPIIDIAPNNTGYTVAHLPSDKNKIEERHNPVTMHADLLFTVDQDNLVTKNGKDVVNGEEYALFDSIVCEFERQAFQAVQLRNAV